MVDPTSESRAEARERVAEALARLRAEVLERHGDVGNRPPAIDEATIARLAELCSRAELHEPPGDSTRPVIGGVVVALRRVFSRLFTEWQLRPLVEQQSAFNCEVSRLVADLLAELAEERHAREQLERHLERLERRLAER